MIKTLPLYFQTVKYLRLKQITWRLIYAVRKYIPGSNRLVIPDLIPETIAIKSAVPFLRANKSYFPENNFRFINLSHQFDTTPDWDFEEFGRLWTYNLNYFEFLLQPDFDKATGLALIRDYCEKIKNQSIKAGLEPYPVSLRCINWIKFILTYDIRDEEIDRLLWAQVCHLNRNLEYHIMGNHLLENAFALMISSFYFNDEKLRKKAQKLLLQELEEQILKDGAHFELCPMYHQILLGRLLDCYNILMAREESSTLVDSLKDYAAMMLGWLKEISYSNGDIPLVNDSALGIAPSTRELMQYGQNLGINSVPCDLNQSGYRKFVNEHFEALVDVGHIGPDYQPGHAHADTFSFELRYQGKPCITDTGTSTYETGSRRSLERSTAAHNTVVVNGKNSSNVWASHRVGLRARVKLLLDTPDKIIACHDGYRNEGVEHQREFTLDNKKFTITDTMVSGSKNVDFASSAHLHFAPGIIPNIQNQSILLSNGLKISFEYADKIIPGDYLSSTQFNKNVPAQKVEIRFSSTLKTIINIEDSFSH